MWNRILIVEDHDDFRGVIRGHLEAQLKGIEIFEAVDGEMGIAMAQRTRPGIVLMDIRLPGMTGIEAASQIKRQIPESQIIALTMFETSAFEQLFKTPDIASYIGKSNLYQDLIPAIKRIWGKEKVPQSS